MKQTGPSLSPALQPQVGGLALLLSVSLSLTLSMGPVSTLAAQGPARTVMTPYASRPRAVAPSAARAIRRDLPLSNAIRRALAAGTRDSSGRPGRKYWQLWTDYTIDARLEPATATITGREHVLIHNTSDSTITNLVVRLDQNLFRPGAPRVLPLSETTDGMTITRFAVNGKAVPPSNAEFALTSVHLPIPDGIAAHGTGTLDVEWSFRVPTGAKRLGRWGDTLVQVALWYPRVAVFDDLNGWDYEPYLGLSEFYNNFGRFDVRLDVPAGWLVGATGVLQNADSVLTATARERLTHVLESDSVRSVVGPDDVAAGRATAPGERLVWHFIADTASDVAWAASNRYVWDATRATIPGKGAVPIHILYLREHAGAFRDAGEVTRHALEFYSKLWMPYAFPQLTMVDGPETGMEYPMFVMSGVFEADHEVGHQWWPMMVGVNETRYGFMDEGFNMYMNRLSAADAQHEPSTFDQVGQEYGRFGGELFQDPPLLWNANYTSGLAYMYLVYRKARPMLSMLGGIVGDSAVWRAMSEYAQAWRFKHPSPWDFAFFMDHALHQDLGWFWYPWFYGSETVDGALERVVLTQQGRRATVTVRQAGQMPAPVVLRVQFAARGPALKRIPHSVLIDSTSALVTYPVDVWFSGRRTFTTQLDFGGRRIDRIVLDPQGRFPDRDPSDNVWPRQPNPAGR